MGLTTGHVAGTTLLPDALEKAPADVAVHDIGVSRAVEVECAFKCIVLPHGPAYSWAPLHARFKAGALTLYLFVGHDF